jgi:hypothetical protein
VVAEAAIKTGLFFFAFFRGSSSVLKVRRAAKSQ